MSVNPAEQIFLGLGYNRFLDLFKEIESEAFWMRDASYRLHRIRDIFSVYAELCCYEPIKFILDKRKNGRPVENELGERLFKFIRNLLSHFPLFENWDSVWISKQLATWEKEGQSIDKFLSEFEGREAIKYRFWDYRSGQMIYLTICFPATYTSGREIFLKDILQEREGVRFSIRLMLNILLENCEDRDSILNELST
jgi:hypothetical protein